MKKNIFILVRVFMGFVLFFVLLLIERAGIPYRASENNSLLVDNTEIEHYKELSDTRSCLYMTDSSDANAVNANVQFTAILNDMRIPYDYVDVSTDDIPDPSSYKNVVVGLKDLSVFGEKILDYTQYVQDGGRMLFWLPFEREDTLDIIVGKLGITDISYDLAMVDYVRLEDGFMLGKTDDNYNLEEYYESSIEVNLDLDSEVFAWCADTPLIWRRAYGDGYFVVCNFGYCEKAYRGIYAAAYSLLDDVCIYPVINASTFYLDDFPSPVPKGDGTYIRRDYKMDTAEFYTNVWWPDVLSMGKAHNVSFTGLIIETYEDQVSGELASNTDVADYYYYGNMLLNAGGEVGYHGYNHQPLCGPDYVYNTELGYKLWESTDEMRDSIQELTNFSTGLFPSSTLQVYVPPSNVISDEGRAILTNDFEDIRVIASSYLPGGDVYAQEFDVEESGMINTPRIVSGGVKSDYLRFAAFSELNYHLVATHFMHPDDLLDEDRGAALGWEYIKGTVDEYMTWIDESAPGIRHLTGSGIAGAVQRYTNIVTNIEEEDNLIRINVDGLIDTAYCMVRVNRGSILEVSGGTISHLYGNLYLLEINENVVEIEIR